jgi:hypothetical protein
VSQPVRRFMVSQLPFKAAPAAVPLTGDVGQWRAASPGRCPPGGAARRPSASRASARPAVRCDDETRYSLGTDDISRKENAAYAVRTLDARWRQQTRAWTCILRRDELQRRETSPIARGWSLSDIRSFSRDHPQCVRSPPVQEAREATHRAVRVFRLESLNVPIADARLPLVVHRPVCGARTTSSARGNHPTLPS